MRATKLHLFAALIALSPLASAEVKDDRENIAFRYLDAIDPTNNESFNRGMDAYDAVTETQSAISTAKQVKTLAETQKLTNPFSMGYDKAADLAVGEYHSSVLSLTNNIQSNLEKVQAILYKISDRINKWRTTLPTLDAYAQSAGEILENTVEHISTFEISDLWDLDQTFFIKLESNVSDGYKLTMSFLAYMASRGEDPYSISAILDTYGAESNVPYSDYYLHYGIPPKRIENLPEESRLDYKVVQEAAVGFKRIEVISQEEYECDATNANLDCNCDPTQPNAQCGPRTMRDFYHRSFIEVMRDPKATMADYEKAAQQIESRRYALAAKRKILTEVKTRVQLRLNDLESHKMARAGSAKKGACLSWSKTLFDDDHETFPTFDQDVCNDMGKPSETGKPVPTGIVSLAPSGPGSGGP